MLGKLELEDRHALAAWRGKREGVGTRVRALLALPLALSSLGRRIAWVGVVGTGVAVVATVAIVVIAVLRGGDDDPQLPVASEATQTQERTPQPTTPEPEGAGGVPQSSRDPMVAVSASQVFTCGLRESGALHCWGADPAGVAEPPAGEFRFVNSGFAASCAIRVDGGVECWGDTTSWQVPEGSYSSVSVGAAHACAVLESRALACWGHSAADEATAPDGRYRSVSAGWAYTCAVEESGVLSCWGELEADVPPGAYRSVSAGIWHACAIIESGEVECWETYAASGQTHVPRGRYQSVGVGGDYSRDSSFACAIRESGELVCWQLGSAGATTNGSGELSVLSVPEGRFRSVSAGGHHACGVRELGGGAVCWGSNAVGQVEAFPHRYRSISRSLGTHACAVRESGEIDCIGDFSFPAMHQANAVVPQSGAYQMVDTGLDMTCAVRESGEIACWGVDEFGWYGDPPPGRFQLVSLGLYYACAVGESGALTCWGDITFAHGDAPDGHFRGVDVGIRHTCAVRKSGELVCWGDNVQAHLEIPDGRFNSVSVGNGGTCALRDSGEVACWGDRALEDEVPTGTFSAVSVGHDQMHRAVACAIRKSGELVCWGGDPPWGWATSPEPEWEGRYSSVNLGGNGKGCAVRFSGEAMCWYQSALLGPAIVLATGGPE